MHSTLLSGETWRFAAFAGIGSVCVLDVWYLLCRKMGVVQISQAVWGRWVIGLLHGYRYVCDYCRTLPPRTGARGPRHIGVNLSLLNPECYNMAPVRRTEVLLGWVLHYLVGACYALSLPLIWGADFLRAPKLWQAMLVCLGLSSLLRLGLLRLMMQMPVNAEWYSLSRYRIALLLVSRAIFAMAQYELARLFVMLCR